MNKILAFVKQYQAIILLVLAGVAVYFLFDIGLEWILGAVGLGGAAVVAKKQKAKEAQVIADEHESLMGQSVSESAKEMLKAEELRNQALDKAKSIKPMPDKPTAGKKRTKFSSR